MLFCHVLIFFKINFFRELILIAIFILQLQFCFKLVSINCNSQNTLKAYKHIFHKTIRYSVGLKQSTFFTKPLYTTLFLNQLKGLDG